MANPEHLEILKQGVKVWNEWRPAQSELVPDLSGADLGGAPLRGANLRGANLGGANLGGANLVSAKLIRADLTRARLFGADLRSSDFAMANLSSAVLADADLRSSHLRSSRLRNSDLRGADLGSADLRGADLAGADFTDATAGYTSFGDNDFSRVRGLETVKHIAPSTVGIDTLYKSAGKIPEVFLRGCGVPEDFITYTRSLVIRPIQFYSCFISYSSKDQEFAERLHSDLQAKGVRVWFAPHDMKIGARIRPTIDESIRVYDKLLLVLSEHSVSSQWVEQEVETALAKEREFEGKTVLFPVRIDDAIMEVKAGWPSLLRNTRNVGDFTHWKDHDSYQKSFDRLLRDLKAEA
jgi:hypothetical protein